jgi:DNA-binding NarL/FixJ family response regulator
MTTRVLVADDQELVRTGLVAVLAAQPDIDVVAEAADGLQAVEETRLHHPDVALLDVRMPHLNGIGATEQICGDPRIATRVLILTTFDLDEYVLAALRAGASGFMLKDAPREALYTAVRTVANGDALLAPSVTRRLIEQHLRLDTPPPPPLVHQLATLTDREREVLRLLARGLTNHEIATQLHLSEPTVRTHVGRIYTKTGAHDRAQAVVFAYESGLITAGQATR